MSEKTIRTVPELLQAELIDEKEEFAINAVAKKYSIAISPHIMQSIKSEGIKRQFVPDAAELTHTTAEMFDPIGDKLYEVVKGLVHRYPDRCLLKPISVCPVYCRFCFRREMVGKGNPALTPQELEDCYAYIRNNKAIWEVILSGGDPLVIKPKQLSEIIKNLDSIEHVEIIRLHTRVPVVAPERINTEMLEVLSLRKPIYIVLHINHPDEFTKDAITAINSLADSGIVLLSQTVLLKGVNDNIEILGKLMRTMVKYRIKPYYLHHLDKARGTNHFRTKIAKGQELIKELRGRYSGLCQPEYVLDIPGAHGKSPIGPTYLCQEEDVYKVEDFMGNMHLYQD